MLNDYYNDNKEIELMESHEFAMVRGYQATKFLTSYGFSESNVSLGMKYLIDKTEVVMWLLNEEYEGFERSENVSMQDLQRKEYELLERIAVEVRKVMTLKTPMEAEMGLIKKKNHDLAEENKRLKAERTADDRELSAKQKILERSISEMNQEITHLNDTVVHLKANLDITEVKIDFNLPQIDFSELQSSRLMTDISVEERLLKGFDLILNRILQLGVTVEEIPEGLLDKQKLVYEKFDTISEVITTERDRAAAAESTVETTRAEAQQTWDLYTAQGQELAVLTEKCAVLEAQAGQVSGTLGTEIEAKVQELTDLAGESVNARWNALLEKVSMVGGKLVSYVAAQRGKQTFDQSAEPLVQQIAALEQEKAYLFEQLQVAEVTYPEPTEDSPVPFGSQCWERVSAILDQAIRQTAGILMKEPAFPETIKDKMRTLFDNLAEIPAKVDGDLQAQIAETTRLQAENDSLQWYVAEAARLQEQVNSLQWYASEAARFETANASLSQQLTLTEVSIQFLDPPIELLEVPEEHAVTEDNLIKGFDFSIQRIANSLGIDCSPPDHLLEKQRCLYDLILRLTTAYDQTTLALTAAKQVISELGQSSEAVVLDLTADTEAANLPVPGLRLYSQLFKGNEYLIEKAARALEKVPFCPPTLLDQQMCLHDLLQKMSDIVMAAKEKRMSLKDAGNTYQAMYEDKGILQKLFWL